MASSCIIEKFQTVDENIDDDIANRQAVIEDLIKLEELQSLHMYCELQMVKQLAALVSGAVALLKMKALEFQEYNGTSDGYTYLIWKDQATNIDEQIADEINKRKSPGVPNRQGKSIYA